MNDRELLDIIAEAVGRIEADLKTNTAEVKITSGKIDRMEGRLDRIEERLERIERKIDRNETRIESLGCTDSLRDRRLCLARQLARDHRTLTSGFSLHDEMC